MAIIEFDIEDYLDEADTQDLIDELISRKIIAKGFKSENEVQIIRKGKRELLAQHLGISHLSELNDFLEQVEINYYK
jgi:hypothetical protein